MFKKRKIETITLRKIIPDKEIAGYNMPFTYEFEGADEEKYLILWEYEQNNLIINIFSHKECRKLNISFHSEKRDSYWWLDNIDVREKNRIGLGTAMMKAYFEIITELDPQINTVKGFFEPLGDEKDIMTFYKSLDGHKLSNNTFIKFTFESKDNMLIYTFL